MKYADFRLEGDDAIGLSPDMRYARSVKLVAEKAPLRILPGERIVGSATLKEAAGHSTPVAGVTSTSHTTLGFDRVLKIGYKGLREQIDARLARGGFDKSDAPNSSPDPFGTPAFAANSAAAYWAEAAPKSEYDAPPLTVECWARLNSSSGFNVIALNRNKDSKHHWEIYSYANSGVFSAYLPGVAPSEIKSDRVITDGQWHYLAMVYSGNRVELWVDGTKAADSEVKAGDELSEGSGHFYIGGYPAGGIGCDGAVGEVRISNATRDVSMIPNGAFEDDAAVLALWKLDVDADSPRFTDRSRNGNHAQIGAPQRGADFLNAMRMCLDAAEIWRSRHMALLAELAANSEGAERENYLQVAQTLERVPENPPSGFREAVQSLWFMYAFQRLNGTWSGIGRFDEMLGPYLEKDLREGRITLDEARELVAHFWIKGCEWIGAFDTRGSGDAQHYQNIILSGMDVDGKDVTNDVTYLVLDVVEELHISDFPIAVRLSERSDDKLFRRIAEVQRFGGGIVAAYNEDVVISGLVKLGYPLEEARKFTNDGCWEVLVPGKTTFIYIPFDMLTMLHQTLALREQNAPAPEFADFEALYASLMDKVREHLDHHNAMADGFARSGYPTPLISMFVEDCIERGRGYHDRGSHYNVIAPHAGGMANVADSLLVLKKLVYEDGRMSLPEFVEILRNDWKNEEPLRQLVLNRVSSYGNDDDEADAMMLRVFNDYTDLVGRVREREGVLRPAGISTFGREIEWSRGKNATRAASPDGHHEGEILATNFSPSPGTDKVGPTAALKSYCKMDFTRTPNGATLELKVHPDTVKGERGVETLAALTRGFIKLGGWFLHIDVVDSTMLIDAQRHPERYPNLSVRVAGWSARFATLEKNWQDMVIGRTQQYC
jgi:formate C-acetyltransferase